MQYISSLWKKFVGLVNADVAFEDEPKQFFVIVRVFELITCCYLLLFNLLNIIFGQCSYMLLTVPVFFLTAICFVSTYQFRTRVMFHIFSAANLIWIFLFVRFFGWDTGIQHQLFPLLILSFFATYSNFRGKLIYTAFLLIFRLYLFLYVRNLEPLYPVSPGMQNSYQILNMVALFYFMFFVCWSFSQKNQEAQEKLDVYNKRLKEEANRDALTGLLNRRSMLAFLQSHVSSSGTDAFLSVAIGDIDFFKKVNDTRGHNCGDDVLCQLADIFTKFMADKGMVCRWGGEEFFFAFLQNGDISYHYMSDLRSRIQNSVFTDTATGETFSITMTFGLEEYDFSASVTELIKRADDKLYIGKSSGRNQVVY